MSFATAITAKASRSKLVGAAMSQIVTNEIEERD
jgi:hypothetical protein